MRRLDKFLLLFIVCFALLAQACTTGSIVDADGNTWVPTWGPTNGTVNFYNTVSGQSFRTSTFSTGGSSPLTAFSFDPNGPSNASNNPVAIPAGHYSVTVTDINNPYDGPWWAELDMDDTKVCPYSDYYTNNPTRCQLLQLKLYPPCIGPLAPPAYNGNVLVVELGDETCKGGL
jgi:hypothetical protein